MTKISKGLWDVVEQRYDKANKAQMITLENQLAISKFLMVVTLCWKSFCLSPKAVCSKDGNKTTECASLDVPESLEAFCDTIFVLPITPCLNIFTMMLQDTDMRPTSTSSSRETLLYVQGKGKWNNSPNCDSSLKPNSHAWVMYF